MIVLDTHTWIWRLAQPGRRSVKARQAVDQADRVGVCAISCWEVAMLVAKERLELDRDVSLRLQQALAHPRCAFLPLTPAVVVQSTRLKGCPGAPADRMIVASALIERAPVVAKDRQLRRFTKVQTIW